MSVMIIGVTFFLVEDIPHVNFERTREFNQKFSHTAWNAELSLCGKIILLKVVSHLP